MYVQINKFLLVDCFSFQIPTYLFLTTITKPPEVIVNKFFLSMFLSSCFHALQCKRIEPT
jgi:hypothetical protein